MVVTNTHGERLPVAYRRMLVPLSGCPGAEQVLPHVVTLSAAAWITSDTVARDAGADASAGTVTGNVFR
jgi:hypothetical protein